MGKPVAWLGTSKKDVRGFPEDARARAGYELYRVQQGLTPADWKPMRGVGAGVREIRIRTARQHRVIYVAKFDESVYVLHGFEKKTQRTSRADVEIARERYRELAATRQADRSKGAGRKKR